MISLIAVALGAAGAAVALPETKPPGRAAGARPGLALGLAVNLQGYDLPGVVRASRRTLESGAGFARDDFEWRVIEPRRGQVDWRQPDRMMLGASRAGLPLLPVMDGTPRWAGSGPNAAPRLPRAYAAFVARVVARYGPGGTFWRAHTQLDEHLAPVWFELYNEPYLALGVPEGPQPAAYARAVAAAVPAARAANPRTRFLLATDTTSIYPDGKERPWLAALHAAVPNFGAYYDGVAVHPYGGAASPDRYTPGRGDRWQTRRLERVRADLVKLGGADKPVWITEIGWSTCRGHVECVSPRTQARYLSRLFELASTRWRPWVAGVVVYALEDHSTTPGNKEGSFGLEDLKGRPKPAWRVLQRVSGRR